MELDQLFQASSYVRQRDYSWCPFDLEVLGEAFRMRDLTPIDLPSVEKGIPTVVKPNSLSKDKEGQLRKHRVKYRDMHKHRHKYGISAENKKRSAHQDSVSEQLKNHQEKSEEEARWERRSFCYPPEQWPASKFQEIGDVDC